MRRERRKERRKARDRERRIEKWGFWLIGIFVGGLIATGEYVCPFYACFHIPCPGCGMTRAYQALICFDLRSAFEYHCLFPIPIAWAVYQLCRKRISVNRTAEAILLALSLALFYIRWIIILLI
ncbi:MAG: DUF2752 domain-containing protein [Christensenellaceae bacterium]